MHRVSCGSRYELQNWTLTKSKVKIRLVRRMKYQVNQARTFALGTIKAKLANRTFCTDTRGKSKSGERVGKKKPAANASSSSRPVAELFTCAPVARINSRYLPSCHPIPSHSTVVGVFGTASQPRIIRPLIRPPVPCRDSLHFFFFSICSCAALLFSLFGLWFYSLLYEWAFCRRRDIYDSVNVIFLRIFAIHKHKVILSCNKVT